MRTGVPAEVSMPSKSCNLVSLGYGATPLLPRQRTQATAPVVSTGGSIASCVAHVNPTLEAGELVSTELPGTKS